MVLKAFICLIICINHGQLLAKPNYQYLGVKQVNQMEAPSLESAGYGMPMPDGDDYGGGGGGGMPAQGGRMRSLAGPPSGGFETGLPNSPNNCGWKDVPHMRSMINPPKKCNKPQMRSLEEPVTPNIKMIDRKKEESECKVVRRVGLKPTDVKTMEKDLQPNRKEMIETYTESYVVTSIKTIYKTRKRVFMQKRKIVNQRMVRPIMIIRRKVIKERQVFERIVPKVIETREIINKPSVQSKIIEGPIYEIGGGRARMMNEEQEQSVSCPEVEFDPNAEPLESVDADAVSGGKAQGAYDGQGFRR